MSGDLPESIDAWRAVAARRVFEGRVPLARLKRLADSLVDSDGTCEYRLEFDRDTFGYALVSLKASTRLPLTCQRSLERFELPITIEQQLGLVRNEREEAALPPDVEAVMVAEDGMLSPLDLIEDELILALPVVPLDPDGAPLIAADDAATPAPADEAEEPRRNPFAALAALKQKQ